MAKYKMTAEEKKRARARTWIQVQRHWMLYLFVIPCVIWLIMFCYVPMTGIVLAFKDYRFDKGIFGSEWAGLTHFKEFIDSPKFWTVIRNTLAITLLKLVFNFPAPIILALLLNEVHSNGYKRVVQTCSYLPNFVSWVVVVALMNAIFTPYGGIYNNIRKSLGLSTVYVMGSKAAFYPLVIFSDMWKNVGWGSIVYLAAITGVDPELYEAASIDGASHFQQVIHITLPEISMTIGLMFIMAVGNLLNAGYDQILLLQAPPNRDVSDILDTYILETGLKYGKYEYATAIGLFKSVFSLILVVGTNELSKRYADISLW